MTELIRAQLASGDGTLAAASAKNFLVNSPRDPNLLAAKAEVDLWKGNVTEAVNSINTALQIDPCSAQLHFDLLRAARLLGYTAIAKRELNLVHGAMPQEREVNELWDQSHDVSSTAQTLRATLERRLQAPGLPPNVREAIETAQSASLPIGTETCQPEKTSASFSMTLSPIEHNANFPYGVGLDAKLNGGKVRLQIDTTADGIWLKEDTARQLGLKLEAEIRNGDVASYQGIPSIVTRIDSLTLGDTVFRHCAIHILVLSDRAKSSPDKQGYIGTNTFQGSLIHISAPTRRFSLEPLPNSPSGTPAVEELFTLGGFDIAGGAAPITSSSPGWDRIKGWSPFVLSKTAILLPTALDQKPDGLWVLDYGSGVNMTERRASSERPATFLFQGRLEIFYTESRFSRGGEGSTNARIGAARFSRDTSYFNMIEPGSLSMWTGLETRGVIGFPWAVAGGLWIDYRDRRLQQVDEPSAEGFIHTTIR